MECRNSRQFVRSRYRHICCAEREDSGAILCCQDHAEALNSQTSAPCARPTRERDGCPPRYILGPNDEAIAPSGLEQICKTQQSKQHQGTFARSFKSISMPGKAPMKTKFSRTIRMML